MAHGEHAEDPAERERTQMGEVKRPVYSSTDLQLIVSHLTILPLPLRGKKRRVYLPWRHFALTTQPQPSLAYQDTPRRELRAPAEAE